MRHVATLPIVVCVVLLAGCATPEVKEPSRTRILDPDQEDDTGGTFLESSDVRTIAQQMTSGLLSTPAIAGHGETARIALAPVRNSTRFLIDSDIFLTRLRIELNRVSEGRVRFFMQDHAQQVRRQILREGDQTGWEAAADEIAGHVLQSVRRSDRPGPVRMAVGSVKNTNITGMNAESFLALLRARLAEQSGGRVVFVSEPVSQRAQQALANRAATTDLGVDYLLGGEFIAQSIQVAEGKKEVELRLKQKTEVFGQTYTKENTDEETLKFEARQNPNVTKWFNCQVVNGADGTIFCEKMVSLEARVASGLSAADFILTGEIRALSKSSQGAYKSDYVIVSFQLVDPRSNEVLWEDAYESKRASQVGTVYR